MIDKNYNLSPILLNAGIAHHNGDWNYFNISNPFFRIYLVIEGEANVSINQKNYRLSPGKLYLIPPFTLHDDTCTGIFSLYYIHIYENQKSTISLFEEYVFPIEVDSDELSAILIDRLLTINPDRELLQYDPKSYTNDSVLLNSLARTGNIPLTNLLETKGILCQLISRFMASAVKSGISKDARIWNAVHYIRDNLNSKIKVPDMAQYCNISTDHLIRLFKKELNTTPVEYINRKKIEKAQMMLVLETTTIKEVAYALAFENISYFNKVFKAMTGKTPSAYLKEMSVYA